ncbi:hypothetical protein HPP92_007497 [Vanilla planifolia]|uniref:DYW domain-containing protein n=1 Tax=Vanilla planifolia TaxID=51239 RepID=A0A835RGJ1_VANPL|nr:hypothetical protein HPP92_007497 [Vanilla planifolia]
MEIHGYALKQGHDSDIQIANTLMAMYTKCSLVKNCELLFQRILNKDVISWTTMIACYAQNGYYTEAIEFFRRVQVEGTDADPLMIGSILQACSGLVSPSFLKQIHGYTIRHDLLDLVLKNTVIDVYGECGMVGHAVKVFEGIKDKDVVSWTSMITCYVRNRLFNDALSLFGNMITANVHPDVVALLGMLSAAAGLASLTKGKEVHAFLIRRSMCVDGNVSSLLVDMYARCGKIDESFKVFKKIGCKDLVLWTSIVDACGMHGMGREAVDLFERMEEAGIVPDHVAFLALLYACSHSRLVVEGKHFFEKMIKNYNLKPWPEHYTCIVDLLGRAGKVGEAYKFIKKMPIKPTAAIWCAFLGACRVYSSYKLGKLAAQKLLDLEPENPGNYVLIANSLAAMGKWEEVKKLRSEMREKGIKKEPGCSWIEVGTNFHVFTARDKLHEASSTIYAKLAEITQVLEKEGGYVPDTSFVLHDVKEEEKLRMLHAHSERLAIAFGLIRVPRGSIIRITKNLRVCGDCHEFTKMVSKLFGRDITVRDANRFHHFRNGSCSCGDFW